jgi:hypothetical protein
LTLARSLVLQCGKAVVWLSLAACTGRALPPSTPALNSSISCVFTYGGVSHVVSTKPSSDPYAAPLQSVFPRFSVRIVNLTSPTDVAHFALYVYDADPIDSEVPLLLHESKYYPPYHNVANQGFTGLHFAYKHGLEEELSYHCETSTP